MMKYIISFIPVKKLSISFTRKKKKKEKKRVLLELFDRSIQSYLFRCTVKYHNEI